MSEQQRLILAVSISFIIVFLWQYFFVEPMQVEMKQENSSISLPQVPEESHNEILPRKEIISQSLEGHTRVAIHNDVLQGSINLEGARIDDLILTEYKTTLNSQDNVVLFSPSKTAEVYFAEFGWLSNDTSIVLPDSKTLWHADKTSISVNDKVQLSWMNPQNIEFRINISLDQNYMFEITKTVINHSDKDVKIKDYSRLNRNHVESADQNFIIHEGAVSVLGETLEELDYSDLLKKGKVSYQQKKGWIGFSDKYWLSALVADQGTAFDSNFTGTSDKSVQRFQVDMANGEEIIKPGAEISSKLKLYAGAKKLAILDKYQETYQIPLFDRSVDFGILYFITKPIFILLSYFYKLIGNFGLAILLLTVFIKLLLFPLAYKGFRGMNRLKDLQPQMAALKEKHKDDNVAFQKALIELYKREKVNPLAGCLPLLLQMPVFFALYKVLYVTIEMRHAPFFLWVKDLSAPDPTTIFNLFGLIAWNPPSFLHIGIFPIFMAFTMYIQQKLSPEPTDPVQAKVMKMLPLIFVFMFSSFPVGLIIYWAWSNILSILQQILIKHMDKKANKLMRKT